VTRAAKASLIALEAAVMFWAGGTWSAGADAPVAVRYVALLHHAAGALQAGDVATAGDDVLAASRLAPSPLVLAPILNDLQSHPVNIGDAQRRLSAADAVLSLPAGAAAGDDGAARRALGDVYRRPAFADLDAAPNSGVAYWARRFGQWLLQNTVGRLGRAGSLAVGGAAIAVIAVLAWRRLRSIAAARAVRTSAEPIESAGGTDAEWALAESAAGRGDFREAVRRAFRSALLAVASEGRVPMSAAWTTRELLRVVAADADLVAALAPAAACFDRAWYSRAPVSAADWATARSRCAAIRSLTHRRVGATR
jgi:hypothetical protein